MLSNLLYTFNLHNVFPLKDVSVPIYKLKSDYTAIEAESICQTVGKGGELI